MANDDNLRKIERFFKYNLEIKKLLNKLIPTEKDFYDEQSKIQYLDNLFNSLKEIRWLMDTIMKDYSVPQQVHDSFDSKINEIENHIMTRDFYNELNKGLLATLQYLKSNVTEMRPEFVDSVKKGFKGYCLFYGLDVLNPETLNEYLHYIHSYVINNEQTYEGIPIIQSNKSSDNTGWEGINLRGIPNELSQNLFEQILSSNIPSDRIDILSLRNQIIIMARDLGHATVIEIEIDDKDNIYIKYFIPKNNNIELTARLKGVNANNSEFATGDFKSNSELLSDDICKLMNGIPTDLDRVMTSDFN